MHTIDEYEQSLIEQSVQQNAILTTILYNEHKKGDKRIMELVKKVNGADILYEFEHFEKAAKYLLNLNK